MPTANKRTAKKAAPVAPVEDVAPAGLPDAGGIHMIALGRLMRAPENVRDTDKGKDVDALADDIGAHGLLQNLIGYQGDTAIDAAAVYIVGGGRRLQALHVLRARGVIADDFAVPVLIRAQDDAEALSLSENLAKRDMNPVDEFLAFHRLMRRGTLSPADLAKQFGFSERYVKQRLRLAVLADEILEAMRRGRLTIDAAMAYAGTQDRATQIRIFTAEEKKGTWAHEARSIRSAIVNAQMTTGSALFKFVTAKDYEKKGGGYEDDLFGGAESYSGRKLSHPGIVETIAADRAHFQMIRVLGDAKAVHATTSDVLLAPGLVAGRKPKAPKGYVLVERGYYRDDLPDYAGLRDRACAAGIDIIGVASINHEGQLVLEPQFFVPAARLGDVVPPREDRPVKTEAQWAAERRAQAIESCRLFLAGVAVHEAMKAGAVEGRRFWGDLRPRVQRHGAMYRVEQVVEVSQDELDAVPFEAGEAEYERQEAAKAAAREAAERAKAAAAEARAARMADIMAMDPPPAVILIDGIAHFHWEDEGWFDVRPGLDEEADYGEESLAALLEGAGEIGMIWPTIEAYDADPHGDLAVEEVDQAA